MQHGPSCIKMHQGRQQDGGLFCLNKLQDVETLKKGEQPLIFLRNSTKPEKESTNDLQDCNHPRIFRKAISISPTNEKLRLLNRGSRVLQY